MPTDPDPKRLDALEEKLRARRKAETPEPKEEHHLSQAQAGWRMVTELVSGLGIGFGIGFGLDYLFGTTPIFMILFILLGFAAGIRVMMRTANDIQRKHAALETQAPREKKD